MGKPDVMARAALPLLVSAAFACVDAGDYEGVWVGEAAGEGETREGFERGDALEVEIMEADLGDLRAEISSSDGLFEDEPIEPIPGAEQDALADITFPGSPLRVFLAFADTTDGEGPALVVLALYGDPSVEVRILRGGAAPLYGIFSLERRR